MNIVFNSLSVEYNSIKNPNDIKNIISQFVELLHNINDSLDVIISDQLIYNFIINNKYGINEWFKDSTVEKKNKDYMRSILNKKISCFFDEEYSERLTIEYNTQKIETVCGLISYLQNQPMISLHTDVAWENSEIPGEYNGILVSLRNFTNNNQFNSFKEDLLNSRYKNIYSGQDLWENRNELFKNLVFCESVKDQLYYTPQLSHIQQIILKLQILNDYYKNNDYYSANILGHGARTESDTVKSNPNLKRERHLKKPDGTFDYFYDHISFTGNYAGRIYFLADDKKKIIYIGYIGKHLQTKKY